MDNMGPLLYILSVQSYLYFVLVCIHGLMENIVLF
jgi:hypothetical protein